jgi:uncharacterized protein YjbJ (UPF0337 family)
MRPTAGRWDRWRERRFSSRGRRSAYMACWRSSVPAAESADGERRPGRLVGRWHGACSTASDRAAGPPEEDAMAGAKDKITGKVKEAEGKVTGDKAREGQGKAQSALGKAKDKVGKAADKLTG